MSLFFKRPNNKIEKKETPSDVVAKAMVLIDKSKVENLSSEDSEEIKRLDDKIKDLKPYLNAYSEGLKLMREWALLQQIKPINKIDISSHKLK